ncbi:hypothetical protein LIER_23093 [Lithospermum erythrorhizon]|uniref:Uncharacterized protein n=1 Tax=Lithospermum erythrorhizon TaxID=34254 RepID=A0AAV3QYR9_LITER
MRVSELASSNLLSCMGHTSSALVHDWRRLPTKNELPAARAYHSMTCIGSRYLLYGGFDGKSTYDDFWWLVPEEDPIAKRSIPIPPEVASEKKDSASAKESQSDGYAVAELQKRLGISLSNHKQILDESEDKDFIDLGKQLAAEGNFTIAQDIMQELRDHWSKCLPRAIPFKELSSLLRDYQRLVTRNHMKKAGSDATSADSGFSVEKSFRFYHMKNASQLRLDDIPQLLAEYNQLVLDK